jgi:hypothetical protein
MSVYFIVEATSYFNGVWIDTEERVVPMTRAEIAFAIGHKWKVDTNREDQNTFYEVFGKMELRYTVTNKVWVPEVEEPEECPCGDHLCRMCNPPNPSVWDTEGGYWDEMGRSEDLPCDAEGFYSPPMGQTELEDDLPF